MVKVQALIDAGASITTAIKEALGMQLKDFAAKYDLNERQVSAHVTGGARATDATINALIAELGGTYDEWALLLWEAGRPQPKQLAS